MMKLYRNQNITSSSLNKLLGLISLTHKAFILSLELVLEMYINHLQAFGDSHLIIPQLNR